jgi:hypothetical protein
MKLFIELLFILCMLTLAQSCSKKAMANQQTLHTSDCGKTWVLIAAGSTIPSCWDVNCSCTYDVRIPDYPMQGAINTKITFKGNVTASIEVSYDYTIFDGKLFIAEAKYLGNPNAASEDKSNSSTAYETAENQVIDNRVKNVARELFLNEDVVDFESTSVEKKLMDSLNVVLDDRGIMLNSLSFVVIFDEQAKLAIDVATAFKIYQSKGLETWGFEIMKAKAGSANINLTNSKSELKTAE